MKKFVIVYIDDDGLEYYRKEMKISDAEKKYGDIIKFMQENKVKVYGPVDDKIFEIFLILIFIDEVNKYEQ